MKSAKISVGCDAVYSYRYISNFTIIRCRDSGSLWAGRFGVRALVGGLRFFFFRARRDKSWGPFSFVNNRHYVFLQRVKRPGRGVDLP